MTLHSEIPYRSKVVDSLTIIGPEQADEFGIALKKHDGLGNVIGTHNGTFHCDEVLACTMLLYTDKYKEPLIVRTRD